MKIERRPHACTRCGKKHLNHVVCLELDSVTNKFHKSGEIPTGHASQGLFRFGLACAARQLEEDHESPHQRRLTRQERLEALADSGCDTWEEYREER